MASSAMAFAAVFAAGSVLAQDAKKEEEEVKAEATEMAEAPKEEMTEEAMAEEMVEEAPPPKLTVGIGGYMEQWFGMTDLDTKGKDDGGFALNSDSEIHFRGKLEADSGLTFSVKVELEGNSSGSQIDESQLTIGGSFGQVVLGSEDEAQSLMHYGHQDAGIGLNAGDTGLWLGSAASFGLNTTGWHGDAQMISYYTPRVSGAQFGASYIPDTGSEDKNMAPKNNDESAWSMGANFKSDLGGASVAFSVGHYQADRVGDELEFISGAAPAAGGADKRITVGKLAADKKAWEKWEYLASTDEKKNTVGTLGADATAQAAGLTMIAQDGLAGRANIMAATDGSMKKGDEKTFSNLGLQVGFGGFSFNVAYATAEGGAYTTMRQDMVVNANDPANRADYLALLNEDISQSFQSNDGTVTGTITARDGDTPVLFTSADRTTAPANDQVHIYNTGTADSPTYVVESATNNDPNNDIVVEKVVKDLSKDCKRGGRGTFQLRF